MRSVLLIAALAGGLGGCAGVRTKTEPNSNVQLYAPNNGAFCLLEGPPPPDIKYERLGRVVATKRTYGGSDQLLEPMAREARKLGADALINLKVGQRFKGPLPWRITSPTGDGQAIRVIDGSPRLDCQAAGGTLI